jgi:predicted nucleotidyltransferase
MRTQPEIVNTIAERIGRCSHVEKVVLFGSRARGEARERSDVDIAVIGPEITLEEWNSLQDYVQQEAETLLSIDLVRFETAHAALKDSIVKEGITLYERQ